MKKRSLLVQMSTLQIFLLGAPWRAKRSRADAPPPLARWPAELASGQQMQVDVINALPAILVAVHHYAVAGFIDAQFFGESTCGGCQLAEEGGLTRRHIIQRAVVLLGNDEDMCGGLREKIVEGDDAFILESDLAGNFMLRNLAENTVHHGVLAENEAAFYARLSVCVSSAFSCRPWWQVPD
jgi:hypothetical protein